MARSKRPRKNLPDDLVIEILLRLPIKSLLKFRLVSKSWLSLISGPQFKRAYGETSACGRRLMIFPPAGAVVTTLPFRPEVSEQYPSVEMLVTPFYFIWGNTDDPVRLVGSCNGLVCLVFPLTDSVVVWNPAIDKYRHLPASSKNKLVNCYGFGYDASSDDFKVVEYSYRTGRRSCYSVYSLRNKSWKTSKWPYPMVHDRRGVFVHGAIHWMVGRHDSPTDVIAVNLATEEHSSVPLPAHLSGGKQPGLLGVSRGRLCLCFRSGRRCWDVWVMEEYGVKESWTVEAYIPYYFCVKSLCDLKTEALCFTEKGDVLVGLDGSECKSVSEVEELRRLISNVPVKAAIYTESFVDPS